MMFRQSPQALTAAADVEGVIPWICVCDAGDYFGPRLLGSRLSLLAGTTAPFGCLLGIVGGRIEVGAGWGSEISGFVVTLALDRRAGGVP